MLTISFSTGSDAFGVDAKTSHEHKRIRNDEIKRILNEVINQLDSGRNYGSCMDINGNKMGHWELKGGAW